MTDDIRETLESQLGHFVGDPSPVELVAEARQELPDDVDPQEIKSVAEDVLGHGSGDETPTPADGEAHHSGTEVYPDELQERKWWVNWVLAYPFGDDGEPDTEAKPTKQPVAPYNTGHARPVLWNNALPDEEHPSTDFSEVVNWDGVSTGMDIDSHERVISDEVGIGIIIPVGGGEGRPITLLDWDDVRDPETGDIHPVCAEAIERLDGFAEISQSGEGIHQFVFGEIPAGLSKFLRHIDDEPFVGDDLPMIEMYSSGRLTAMTGRHVAGCGEDVVEGQQLVDDLCWKFGQGSNNNEGTPTDPFADERDDVEYTETPDHEDIADSLREAIAYDGDDPRDWDIPDGESIRYHAVLRAREREPDMVNTANWELLGYAAALAAADDISKEQLIEDLRNHERPGYEFDEQKARKEIRGVFRKANDGSYEPPSHETLVDRGILPEEYASSTNHTPISEDEAGLTIRKTTRDNEIYFERLTNFHVDVEAILERDTGDSEFLLTVNPVDGPAVTVAVEPSVFNEKRKFDREICGATLSGTFDGGQEELNRLKEYVAQQDAPVRRGTEHIGLHDNEWVVPDGTLAQDGWTDEPETVHQAEDTPLANKCSLSPSMGDDYDRDTVAEIIQLLPQTRLTERFLPAMGWFYAAATRPHIQDWEGEFNILAVTGDTGAGKTATLEMLWGCFGVDGDLLRADGTTFPKMRALATSNALPVIFDEYKPADMSNYAKDQLHSLLRTSTRGGIEEKGRPDGSVVGHHLLAPVVVSGEQALRGTAEERRTLQTNFSRQASVGGSPESEAFARLTGGETSDGISDGYNLSEHALAYYSWILRSDPAELKAVWRAARTKAVEHVADMDVTGLDDMRLQAIQTMIYGCRLYQTFASDIGVADVPIGEREIDRAVSYILNERTSTEHVSNLDRLLELAGRAAAADYLERGEHFEIICEGEPDEELRLKLSLVYDQLRRYARDHDIQDADLLDSDTDYRSRISDAAENDDSYVVATSKQTPGLNRCVAIQASAAEVDVEGFEIGLFRTVDDDGTETDTEEQTLGFDLGSLDPSRGSPVTFRATLASHLEPAPWLQAEGILQDDSGVARFIARGDSSPLNGIDESTTVEVRDAMVTTNGDDAPVVEIIDGLTEVVDASSPDGQSSLEKRTTADGGDVGLANKPVDDYVRSLESGDEFTVGEVAGATETDPGDARSRLETLASERRVIVDDGDGQYTRL